MAEVLINSLDAGNHLYLQNNDDYSAPIVNVKLTSYDNYKMWYTTMKIALKGKNKMRFVDDFDTLTLLLACTCAAHEWILKHNQLVRLMQFLMGLNDVYQPIRSNILAREPLLDVKETFNVVSIEESHRGGNYISKTFDGSVEAKGVLLPSLVLRLLINEKPSRSANANMAGMKLTFFKGNVFLHFKMFFRAQLTSNIFLFDVLVVLEYCVSLFSVHKLIKDSKLFVGFDEHKCYIQDLNLVKTVGTSNESGGLYLFDEDKYDKSKFGLFNYVFLCHVSKQLWHSRLGHPSDQVLSILSKNISLKYDKHVSPCDICHKAKQTRDPFPLSDHKFNSVGSLFILICGVPTRCPHDDERDPSNGDVNVRTSSNIDNPHLVIDEATFAT
ncbi:ribonuclease H-like domain-containing protein [Tanacetum coccineum]